MNSIQNNLHLKTAKKILSAIGLLAIMTSCMMGPDYTHWHGMYEVSKHFYDKFLPAVVEAAKSKSKSLGKKYEAKIQQLLTKEEHRWLKGLSPAEVEALQKEYKQRYDQ